MSAAPLYDSDFHEWAEKQAALLRRMAADRVNSELDLDNLAEEVESMAGSDRRELSTRLSIVIEHLLKLAYCFYPDPRRQWMNSVRAHRSSMHELLDQSPSLRRLIPQMLTRSYNRALDKVETETIDLTMDAMPRSCPFDLDQILDEQWEPEPPVRFHAQS